MTRKADGSGALPLSRATDNRSGRSIDGLARCSHRKSLHRRQHPSALSSQPIFVDTPITSIMFAARNAFAQAQRRAFSASARQVRCLHSIPTFARRAAPRLSAGRLFAAEQLLLLLLLLLLLPLRRRTLTLLPTVLQGHRPRCRRWYRPAALAAAQAEPSRHQAVALRHPPCPRYAFSPTNCLRHVSRDPPQALCLNIC